MDTEAFILTKAEICNRLEERRLAERIEQPSFNWTSMMGSSVLTTLRMALQMGGGRSLSAWLPRTLISIAAPAVIGLLKNKGIPFLGKKSVFERFSSFIPFLKSV